MSLPAYPLPSPSKGRPSPLGATLDDDGVNFALFSAHATLVTLCLFQEGASEPFEEFVLDPHIHRSGSIWHIKLAHLAPHLLYAYRIAGPKGKGHHFHPKHWLIDPYAKGLFLEGTWRQPRKRLLGEVFPATDFNWEGDAPLHLPWEEMIIYEMHLRGYTQDPSSGAQHPGTFLGLIEKITHLQTLGINAIELLPIFPFDELAHPKKNLCNYWGYSPLHFFSPMTRYASHPSRAIAECKEMIKALHRAKIEVILDVVFNHTGEGKSVCSFRGIDNQSYYLLDTAGKDYNFSGCGNTLACNEAAGIELIVSALRYWVEEFHIDGFRFDLASIFCRGQQGQVFQDPPVLQAILKEPALAKTKFIAEAWDCGGLYQVGSFPGGERFAEWNGRYRDEVRRFLKGTKGHAGAFASVLSGSENLYGKNRTPYHSINFITAHDGFSLHDLVSYNHKYNEDNGEHNRDGNDWNESWNCGEEGPTRQAKVLALRKRQMRNFLFTLAVSMGTPMFLMGDEYGHTRKGNNNSYCQDNQLNYFLWDELEKHRPFTHFLQKLIAFRKKTPLFHRNRFLTPADVVWHGKELGAPDWSRESRLVAYTLLDPVEKKDLYLAFNASWFPVDLVVPPGTWDLLVDTSLPSSDDFPDLPPHVTHTYTLPPHSCLLLQFWK